MKKIEDKEAKNEGKEVKTENRNEGESTKKERDMIRSNMNTQKKN